MKTQLFSKVEGIRKSEQFKDYPHVFDTELPQDMLNGFAAWCKENRPTLTYDLIRSTSVWAYPPEYKYFGTFRTSCTEVYEAYRLFTSLQWNQPIEE